ncbi:MAG TPA: BatA domain-containing protein [Longimicrobiales bacterium]|nr:BatA domain-containing protein [Longimicrobiales bacterium]
MGLLQPWLLMLAAAAAVPLLLHLLQRHQGPRILFPALRYLRRAERESARRIRLRQLLLMLLRVAAVLLLAVAAARPFLLGAGSAHQPAAVVIVLDNSVSTGAVSGERRVLDELRERALETLAAAGPDDRFWLLRTTPADEPALAGDAVMTAERVRETEPGYGRAELAGALARARALLAAGSGGRAPEIQLLSDLQANELEGIHADGPAPPVLAWVPSGSAPRNHGVSAVGIAGGMAPLAGSRIRLSAHVTGAGTDPVGLRVFLDERLVAAAAAPPGATALLGLPARPAGMLTGRVEADPDALRADDRRYFAVRVLPPPGVVAPTASSFLADALAVMADAGRVRLAGAADADVALLPGALGIEAVRADAASIVLPPASAVELPAVNRRLAAAGIGWRYEPVPSGAGAAVLAIADTADPLLGTLARAQLAEHYALVDPAGGGDSVLLRLREGAPWLVRGVRPDGGAFLLLGSPLTAEATSIPTSAAMIPLLDRMLTDWVAPEAPPLELRPGAEARLGQGPLSVLRPDGVEDDAPDGRYRLPHLPGIYHVRGPAAAPSAFALNVPAAESDLRRAAPGELRRRLDGWRVRSADTPARWARGMYQARLGMQLWRPLLLGLLALLIIEAVIAATGARRRAAANEVETA